MSQPYKVCPRCQRAADLAAPRCEGCGRVYKTQFVPPEEKTQMFPGLAPQAAPAAAEPPAVELRVSLGKPGGNRKMLPYAIGGLLILGLLVTNPGKAEFVSWLKEVAVSRVRTEKPKNGWEAAGQGLGMALIGPYLEGHTTTLNLGVFTLFTLKGDANSEGARFIGVAKFFIPLQPFNNSPKPQEPEPTPAASTPSNPTTPVEPYTTPTPPAAPLVPSTTTPPASSFPSWGDAGSTPTPGPSSTILPAPAPIQQLPPPSTPPDWRDAPPANGNGRGLGGGLGLAWDPNVLPCGHQFHQFEPARGVMEINGRRIREVGVCTNGHRYAIVGTTWVKAPGY